MAKKFLPHNTRTVAVLRTANREGKKRGVFFCFEMVAGSTRQQRPAPTMLDKNMWTILEHYKNELNGHTDTIVDVRFFTGEGTDDTLRARVEFYDGTNAKEHISQLLQNDRQCCEQNLGIYKTFDRSKHVFCIAHVPDFGVAIMLAKRPGT